MSTILRLYKFSLRCFVLPLSFFTASFSIITICLTIIDYHRVLTYFILLPYDVDNLLFLISLVDFICVQSILNLDIYHWDNLQQLTTRATQVTKATTTTKTTSELSIHFACVVSTNSNFSVIMLSSYKKLFCSSPKESIMHCSCKVQ